MFMFSEHEQSGIYLFMVYLTIRLAAQTACSRGMLESLISNDWDVEGEGSTNLNGSLYQ